jgi:hypothetical protein
MEGTTANFGETTEVNEVPLPSVDQTLKDHQASINGHSPGSAWPSPHGHYYPPTETLTVFVTHGQKIGNKNTRYDTIDTIKRCIG